ncbi:MAG: MATE family efflux transporter [Candidatus Coproplasma sp.]
MEEETINQSNQRQIENPMGYKKVARLMLSMGLPMILSMVVQALYNVVDTMFVTMISHPQVENYGAVVGTNALSLAFPVQMLMIAIGVGLGVGVNAMLSRALGEGERKKAAYVAGNALTVIIIVYAVFLLFGLFGVRPYLSMQADSSDPNYELLMDEAANYLSICCTMSFGALGYMVYEKLLQGTGKATLCMIGQISGAVLNIGLDALFVLVFGWGVAGAAWATVIGQIVSLILDAVFHYALNREISGSPVYMRPRKDALKGIFTIGLPAVVMQALMPVMVFAVNVILAPAMGNAAVTAYGDYYKVQQFVFFAAFGLNNAIIPIVSFNYGLGDKQRVKEGVRYGIIYTVIVMALGIALFEALAQPVSNLLTGGDQAIGGYLLTAMRVVPAGFLFVGFNVAWQGILQALGSGVKSLILSCLRLIVVCLPLVYAFSVTPIADFLVWWAFPIAEAVASIAALAFGIAVTKKKINAMSA